MKTISWMVDDKEERRLNRLKRKLRTKTYSHVLRVATEDLEEKILKENALYGLQDKDKEPKC